jgi:Protein of unknown function (DUF1153)
MTASSQKHSSGLQDPLKPVDRWTPNRRDDLLAFIDHRVITEQQAWSIHGISAEELLEWRRVRARRRMAS